MNSGYYKIPLDFASIIEKKEVEKTDLENSISQYILLIATTALGECKFDENLGSQLWEVDFDFFKTDDFFKKLIRTDLKRIITVKEKRLILEDILVDIRDINLGKVSRKKVKKKISILIKGQILETDSFFSSQNYFFIGPLSY